MFRHLYRSFLKELRDREDSYINRWVTRKMIPEYSRKTAPERIAVDYIANMTDRYFNEEFRRRVIPENFGFKF